MSGKTWGDYPCRRRSIGGTLRFRRPKPGQLAPVHPRDICKICQKRIGDGAHYLDAGSRGAAHYDCVDQADEWDKVPS